MSFLGWLLLFLSAPLFIGHFLSNKQDPMRLSLGALLAIVGVVIILIGG